MFSAASYESWWKSIQKEDSLGSSFSFGRLFLWLLVPLFQGASLLKRAFFIFFPWFKTSIELPVITIGNITMGGTGKTTVARFIGDLAYQKWAKVPAVLSRGYRSPNKLSVLPVSRRGELMILPDSSGDEAFLLARWMPYASVILGKKRAVTGLWASENYDIDYLLLDDGHQYWRLNRQLNIVTVSAVEGFGNGYPFPRGILREPLWGLKRADIVVLYQYSEAPKEQVDALRQKIQSVHPTVPIVGVDLQCALPRPVLETNFRPGMDLSFCEDDHSIAADYEKIELTDSKVLAFSGLGSPLSFEKTLEGAGASVVDSLVYSDHHRYTVQDVKVISQKAQSCGARYVLTTEKDEVNLLGPGVREEIATSPVPFLVLPVVGDFTRGSEEVFLKVLEKTLCH